LTEIFCGNEENLTKKTPLYLNRNSFYEEKKEIIKEYDFDTLEINNINYNYVNSNFYLKNISFNINKFSLNVITGKVGSGKSTLLRIILGVLTPQSGHIIFNGNNIRSCEELLIPPLCSYMPQSPKLFNDTIYNNITLGRELKSDISEYLRLSCLNKEIDDFENGLETLIGTDGHALSGGQRKRVAYARMLASESQFFIIDDFASSLDIKTKKFIWNELLKLNKTLLVVSNDKYLLSKSDNIIVFNKGEIEDIGSIDTLKNKNQFIKHILAT
jgi:ATP-binding cassette subfamily B protein